MSHSVNYQTIVAGTTIIRNKEGKYLFTKRAANEGYAPDKWDFPGGAKEYLESAEEGAIRECKEESGLDVEIKKMVWHRVSKAHNVDNTEFVSFYFLCEPLNEEVQLSHEHSDYQWLSLEEGRALDAIPWMTEFYAALDEGVIDLTYETRNQ